MLRRPRRSFRRQREREREISGWRQEEDEEDEEDEEEEEDEEGVDVGWRMLSYPSDSVDSDDWEKYHPITM